MFHSTSPTAKRAIFASCIVHYPNGNSAPAQQLIRTKLREKRRKIHSQKREMSLNRNEIGKNSTCPQKSSSPQHNIGCNYTRYMKWYKHLQD